MTKEKTNNTRMKLFEFYRVFDDSITDRHGDGHRIEPCEPLHQRATYSNLSKVCANAFGAGSFVALEIAPNLSALPLSYWVIKIKSRTRQAAKEVLFDDQRLQDYRQFHYLAPIEGEDALTLDEGRPYDVAHFPLDIGWNPIYQTADFRQRMAEASLAACELKSLPDPEDVSQRRGSPEARAVRDMLKTKPRPLDKAIIDCLLQDRAKYWPGRDEDVARTNAERTLETCKRDNRRKRQKVRETRKKRTAPKS